VSTNLPEVYNVNGGNLTFLYNGQTLKGQTTGLTLNIADDINTRYGIPVVIGLILVVLALLYVRRLVRPPKQ